MNTTSTQANKKVLVVDDMNGIRQSVSYVLKQAGYDVSMAENGEDAINKLKAEDFNVMITDIFMPVKDGIAVLEWLAEQDNKPRIITMSGGGAQETADQALMRARLLSDRILMKPYAKKDLLDSVERLFIA
jgi:DNA-binding NtrC family response regulator